MTSWEPLRVALIENAGHGHATSWRLTAYGQGILELLDTRALPHEEGRMSIRRVENELPAANRRSLVCRRACGCSSTAQAARSVAACGWRTPVPEHLAQGGLRLGHTKAREGKGAMEK